MAAPQLKQGLKYKVHFQRGNLVGQSMSFEKAVIQIGRGTENDLILLNDLRASRHHAEIHWDGTELRIVNVSTKNFIAVNGSQVEAAVLEPGSVVLIGESEFRIEFEAPHLEEPKTKVVADPSDPVVVVQMPVLQQTKPAPFQQSMAPAIPPMGGGVMGGAAGGHHQYSPNIPGHHMGGPQAPRPRSKNKIRRQKSDSGKARFYGIVLVIGVVFAWLMNSNDAKKKELTFRSTEQIEKDIEASREELKTFEARKEKLDNVQFKRAQENYIRGFRDYKQGNYGRARESFQVVLNLDPDNELAKRYYQLARLKFDEMVKFHMLQGNRYREKKNWRMCKSSYFNVMTMVANNQDPVFKEAKQYYDQCSLAQEGRY
ncbi:FHA domain-containing protein [Bdellovibrio sp. HCB337]|uniref:FHA domain-containing protein n=1 Tax=Bdellovibrio sp. HCB337 TaxID=3394358 RepID=UPI0039A48D60